MNSGHHNTVLTNVTADVPVDKTGKNRSREWWSTSLRRVLDLAFPPQCLLCGVIDYSATSFSGSYCSDCVTKLCPTPINRCQCCGAEIGLYSVSKDGCTHCRHRNLRFESVTCLGMYEGPIRKAILAAKWSFSAVPIRSLGRLLATERIEGLQLLKVDRVIPIPQHWRQRVFRHFNPAWLVAEEIAAALRVPCDPHVLYRQRPTRAQKRVPVSQRFENQNDAFALQDLHVIDGERILLVDDVLTTGATCSEATRLLKRNGANECHVAVLGRVLDSSA